MLSITPLKSASKSSNYYLNEEKNLNVSNVSLEKNGDNYYLKDNGQGENSFWHGKLAEEAGLANQPVKENQLTEVLSGKLNSETVHAKREQHKAGFDFTLSAPKSLSILALVGGDSRLLDIHNDAVKYVLTEIEKDAAQAKVTDKESGVLQYQNTQSMIFAVVQHKTSREDDMQIHSHALGANMTRDEDGKLRALASCLKQKGGVINGTAERIYNNQKYYTALYHSYISKESVDLGYSIRAVGQNQIELGEVPENVIEHFSKRSAQIEQKTLELGYDSQATRDIAAKNTRKDKSYASEESLNSKWENELKHLGFDPKLIVAASYNKEAQTPLDSGLVKQAAVDALQRAVSHLGQTSTALSLEKIITSASTDFIKPNEREGVNAIDIKQAADQLVKSGELIPLDEKKGLFTTQAMLDNEQRLLSVSEGRASHMRTAPNQSALAQLKLSAGNSQKIEELFQSTKQFNVVNVFGTTQQIAESILHVGNDSGKRVHIISANANDKAKSSELVKTQAHTFSQWISNLFKSENRHTTFSFLNDKTTEHTNRDLWLVDSANKLSAQEILSLAEKAKESNSKVVFLNRVTSRQGIKAHSALDLFAKGNVQSSDWVNNKQVESSVYLHDKEASSLANEYAAQPNKENVQVVAMNRLEAKNVTAEIRESLKNSHQLSRTGIHLDTQNGHYMTDAQKEVATQYKIGMSLRTWEDKKPTEYLISGINRDENALTLMHKSTGDTFTIDPSTKQFKAMNTQAFAPEGLEITVGEKLLATANHYPSGLKSNESYTVEKIQGDTLSLVSSKGQIENITRQNLIDAPLQYGYVSNKIDPTKDHVMLTGKSYSYSKELLKEATDTAQRVDIYTDNVEKTHAALEKSEVRPSAIYRVMESQGEVDKYVSGQTSSLLLSDVNTILKGIQDPPEAALVEKAVSFALSHVGEREAGFTQKELVVEAVRYAFEEAGKPITGNEIIAQLQNTSNALSSEFHDGTRWTTQEAIETEKHILDNITQGKESVKPFATAKQVNDYLAQHPNMTNGQKESITLISTSPDRFNAVQGLAGTGKSTMLETNIELIQMVTDSTQNKPSRVEGLAPTHAAVSELQSKGVKARTLESLLSDVRAGKVDVKDYSNTLFLLDESSMVSNRQAKELTDFVLASNSRAVLLGDKEQLLSLSAGKPFEIAMSKGDIKTAYMTDIVRQQNEKLLGAVHNILDKQVLSSLDKLTQQPDAKDGINKTHHVISTLDESMRDKAKAQDQARLKLPYAVATDYLARSEDTRKDTLIIAYTNSERDNITEYIRKGKQTEGSLGKEQMQTNRIRSVGASREELGTMLPYKVGLILSRSLGKFEEITHIDKHYGVIVTKDTETGMESTFLPRTRDNKFTQLFAKDEKPLSVGDSIITRFTDKERGINANEAYTVTSISNEAITAQSEQGQTLTIDPKKTKDGHWDYGYTRTADLAQGATYKNVIVAIRGSAILTDVRRAYIDQTRASEHVRLYTDNPSKMINSWYNHDVNKQSAIETANSEGPKSAVYFNDNPVPKENPKYQDINGEFVYSKFTESVKSELGKYTESLAESLLGKPNRSKSDRDYLAFGEGKTLTKVSLTGPYRGYWKDYTTGEKGSLVNLIMVQKDLSYKDALIYADKMLTNPSEHNLIENSKHEQLLQTTPKQVAKYEDYAKAYFSEAREVTGTIGQTYLEKNGITQFESDNVKFHPRVYSSESKSVHPALIAGFKDSQNELRAIEIHYLSPNGDKANLDVDTRILGTKSGNVVEFHKGDELNTTIISTSTVDAYALREATQGKYDIYSTHTKNDIQNIDESLLRQNIVIALDSANVALTPDNIQKIMSAFQGHNIEIVSTDNILDKINEAIDKLENGNKELTLTGIDMSEFTTHSINTDSEQLAEYKSQNNKEELSTELEHHIPHQKEFEFDREMDMGIER